MKPEMREETISDISRTAPYGRFPRCSRCKAIIDVSGHCDCCINPERDKLARELAEAWLSPATIDRTPEEMDEVARKLQVLLK